MGTLIQDVRYGLRGLRQNFAFTLVAVCSLALGIGANTAIFSLVNAVLLTPPPFREPERLAMVWEEMPSIGAVRDEAAPANYLDWKAQNRSFEEMAALSWKSFNLTGDGEPERVPSYAATANLFGMIGARPAMGRTFLPEENEPGAAKVAVLSHGLWQRRFGGDPSVVGRSVLLDGAPHTVVGVMPRGFQFLQSYIGVWVPLRLEPEELTQRSANYLMVLGRLREGVTPGQAQADIGAITARIAKEYPDSSAGLQSSVVPLREQLAGKSRRPLVLLLGAVGFVLLIACANVANLLLARAAKRRREFAVRTALGASRWRVARQLLTESVLLSALGGAAGLLLAAWGFEFLKKLVPDSLALSASLGVSLPVFGYALALSVLTGVVFGMAPALQASRADVNEVLKQGGRTGYGSAGRLRGALVVTEVALALVLLVGAGLLMQTVSRLRGQYAELRPEQLLTARTVLPDYKYRDHGRRAAFYEEVLARVRQIPGVVSAGYTTSVPLQWKGGANGFTPEGEPPPGVATNAIHRQVSAGYLETLGVGLREGRYLDARDDENGQPVLVVNETMARKFWPGGSAIGRRIRFSQVGARDEAAPWRTIVGVVADVRQIGMDAPVKAEMYLPHRQVKTFAFFRPRDLVVRAAGDPLSLVPAVTREVRAVDADQPLSNVATMEQQLGAETGQRGTGMLLLAAFAGLALLLAAVGIYGVLAYFVAQHVPEIGVRLALGARPRDILALVLRKGMGPALFGIALGLCGALALTRVMSGLLYGVSATDPTTFALISLLIVAVALLACYLPARRATKVDPMVALRSE